MQIGKVKIDGKAMLAPMAGVADRAFRELCVEFGAAYVVSEMVSSKGLFYSDEKSKGLMVLSDKERPAAIQIFGDHPETMAKAAQSALQFHPEVIDINMGCPAPKVNTSGGGASLMKTPKLCGEIVAAVVKAVDLPVTVKIRKGWDEKSVNALEVAKIVEEAGVSALAIHGRTRAQMYAPSADWEIIARVKEALEIPVIGNGDIVTPEDAARMLEETNCDMVMIGRGACGNPWLFSRINAYLEHGVLLPEPSISEKMRVMCLHIGRICEYKGEGRGMREARKHAAWYMHGLKGAAAFRQEAGTLESMAQLENLAMRVIAMNRE